MKKLKGANTPLERFVQKIINKKAADYTNGAEGVLRDLMYGGCQSGTISELIYYHDTVPFYKKHRDEIDKLLQGLCSDCGQTPAELFGDKWDKDDFFARERFNQNLLAWFGFEETARNLATKNGIEL